MKKCANHYAVAVDLGASGGKMAAASFDGSRIELADYITFPNQPVQILDTYIGMCLPFTAASSPV